MAGAALAGMAGCGPAWAHESEAASSWASDGFLVAAVLCVSATLYFRGWRRLRSRAMGVRQASAFSLGSAALGLTLSPQADRLADQLFSAHMVQHLALILVAAPLLSLGRTGLASLAGLPRGWRRALGRTLVASGLVRLSGGAGGALLAWILFCGAFAFWHLPGPYSWALAHEWSHVVEHVSFFASSYAFWSVVFSRAAGAIGFGARLVFVSTAAVVGGLPGALMILATRTFYPTHAAAALAWGLNPIEDQQLAGLVMWIPAGFVYLGAICWLAVAWLEDAERRARLAARPATGLLVLVTTALLVLPGCEPENANATAVGGDARTGAKLIADVGCGACHAIPGIAAAKGLVGPPLTQIGRRVYLAGLLRNTPENMVLWLRDPQSVVPGNAMPNIGLSEQQARDIASYLATLQ